MGKAHNTTGVRDNDMEMEGLSNGEGQRRAVQTSVVPQELVKTVKGDLLADKLNLPVDF